MSTRQVERKWIVTLRRTDEDDWPDIKRTFSRASVFRPDTVIVTVSRRDGAEISVEEVSASGPRVLKAGLSDVDRYSEHWTSYRHPDQWVADLAAGVLEQIRSGD